MKYFKKMTLIPYKNDEDVIQKSMALEDTNSLTNILKRDDLSIDERMKLYLSEFTKFREKKDFKLYSPTVKTLDSIKEILKDIQKIKKENQINDKTETSVFEPFDDEKIETNKAYYKLGNNSIYDEQYNNLSLDQSDNFGINYNDYTNDAQHHNRNTQDHAKYEKTTPINYSKTVKNSDQIKQTTPHINQNINKKSNLTSRTPPNSSGYHKNNNAYSQTNQNSNQKVSSYIIW